MAALYTYDEVVNYLREAHKAVSDADVPDDLRTIAFTSAVNALSAKPAPQPVAIDSRLLGRH